MFELAFVEGRIRTDTPWTVTVSFCGQLVLVGLAVLYPLILTETIPGARLVEQFFAPAPPPARRAPEAPAMRTTKVAVRPFVSDHLTEPVNIPRGVAQIVDPAPDVTGGGSDPNGVVGGIDLPAGAGNAVIRNLLAGAATPLAPAPRSKDPEPV